MNTENWLKRKYPISFTEIRSFFDDSMLEEFKRRKYRIGRLNEDIIRCQRYHKDSLIVFKRSNPATSYNKQIHYGIAKCQKGYTDSGYHSFDIYESDFTEIKK